MLSRVLLMSSNVILSWCVMRKDDFTLCVSDGRSVSVGFSVDETEAKRSRMMPVQVSRPTLSITTNYYNTVKSVSGGHPRDQK
jgi:hypothetical protein